VGATDNNNGAVYQFRINANGTLAPLAPASAVSTQQPIAMQTDSQGRFLYSADHNFGLRSYVVNGDGTLTRNGPDTPSGQAFSLAVSPNDKFVLLGSLPAQSLAIQPDGKLVKVGDIANFGTPDGITINPASTFAYATASVVGASGIQALAIAPDGTTTAVGAPVPFGAAAYKVVITPDGKFVYAVSLSAPDNVVGQFKVNANGSLTPLSPATVPASSFTTNVTVSPDGKFLYTTNYRDNTVSQFRINADGTLTPLNPPFVHG
jgi:6-phosphogluconolactonase (cycloisomerase 2 family)